MRLELKVGARCLVRFAFPRDPESFILLKDVNTCTNLVRRKPKFGKVLRPCVTRRPRHWCLVTSMFDPAACQSAPVGLPRSRNTTSLSCWEFMKRVIFFAQGSHEVRIDRHSNAFKRGITRGFLTAGASETRCMTGPPNFSRTFKASYLDGLCISVNM